jgi:hypothetical protein
MNAKTKLMMRLGLSIVGVLVSFVVYPMFSDLFAGGFLNIMSNLTSLALLLVALAILLILPYLKFTGFGLLLGLLLNYFYSTGVI